MTQTTPSIRCYKVAIIGAGFGGIGMGYYLKQAGIDDFVIFDKAAEVGGTWRENTYPGSGCDVPSHMYSFSFERGYPWAWRYAKQSEILAYSRHCVDKHGIAPHIRFGCEVGSADYDQTRGVWTLTLDSGECAEAVTVVSAVGQLDRPFYPAIPGREKFSRPAFHSAHWNHDFDFMGKTVGVIGSGASAVQLVPEIVGQVSRLHLFQRSPGWVAPKFERRFSRLERWLLDHVPGLETLDRFRIYLILEGLAYAYNGHKWAERLVTFLSKTQLRVQVRDPSLRARLTPDFSIGCKRILLTKDWLPALTRPNVEVVSEEIQEITETGMRTADGRHRELDAIVYGTGFAATQFLTPMKVTGPAGRDLHAAWAQGAGAYLGMAVAGFPNFFVLYGPNTNVGSGSIIFMLECQQRFIVKLMQMCERNAWSSIEVRPQAEAAYDREMQTRSAQTTYSSTCHSWYKTADGRNTNNWVGSMTEFRRRTAQPEMAHFQAGETLGQTAAAQAP